MKLDNFKINILSENNMSNKEMSDLKGGNNCSCSCYWANQGGSSIEDNRTANYNSNYQSIDGCNQYGETDCCYYYWFMHE